MNQQQEIPFSRMSMGNEQAIAVTFDDMLLVPQYSKVASRGEVDLYTSLKYYPLDIPIIAANMDTVCGVEMARLMASMGGLGVIHRYMTNEDQLLAVEATAAVTRKGYPVAAAIGVKNGVIEHAHNLVEAGANVLVVDVAHGHHALVGETVAELKNSNLMDTRSPTMVEIVAGNVATPDGAMYLFDKGADTVKVGVGSGSICSTRTVTGHGVPQLGALVAIKNILHRFDGEMIADGGIRSSGDIVKALAAGASAVMVGSLLAGTQEAPGDIIGGDRQNKYKVYRGMASRDAQTEFYGNAPNAPEGVSVTVPYRGPACSVIQELIGGIASGLSYSGAKSIKELVHKAQWIKVTSAAAREALTIKDR